MKKNILRALVILSIFIFGCCIGKQLIVSAKILVPKNYGEQDAGTEIIEKENIEIDGYHYEYIKYCRDTVKKKIRIMSLKTKEDVLVIPAKICGESVVEVGMELGEGSSTHFVGTLFTYNPWQLNEQQILKKIVVSEGIRQIVYCGFANTSAECIDLPKSLLSIGSDMFHDNCFTISKIKHVIIKGSKTNIGGYVFANSDLKKITLPKNYQGKIGSNAFQNSTLEEFKWPAYKSGVTKNMESGVFQNCKNLKKVTFPKNQKHIYIPSTCFYGCTKLKKLTFPASTKKVTYDWTPYADNYKMGPGTLVFKGKKTAVTGVKYEYNKKRKWKVLTVGKIIAPKNSKALAYAKKAKRVKWLAKSVKTDIKRYTGPEVNYVDREYNSDIIKLAKMKYSILKK